MKLLLLACPHGEERFLEIPLKGIDAVLIAGDLGKADKARSLRMSYPDAPSLTDKLSSKEAKEMLEENISSSEKILRYFSQKPVSYIPGNADESKKHTEKINREKGLKIKPLEDRIKKLGIKNIDKRIVKIGSLKVAGLGYFVARHWVKEFLGTDKHRTQEEEVQEKGVEKFISRLEKVDMLLCHNPPYGYLDLVDNPIVPKNWNKKHAGSKIILDYILEKQPKYAVFGHIHEARGEGSAGQTKLINTACGWTVFEI